MTDNWEEPKQITIQKMPAFPTEILPDWIKNYVEGLSKELNTPVDLSVTAVFSVLSTSLVRKYQFNYEPLNWVLDLNTYLLLGSDPGSKKDNILQKVFNVLTDLQRKELKKLKGIEHEILSELDAKKYEYEKLIKSKGQIKEIKKLKKEILKLETKLLGKVSVISGDITQERIAELLKINDESLTISTAEASELFDHLDGKYKSDSLDIYLKSWEGSEYAKMRVGSDDVYLNHPLLSLCLFTQPQEIMRLRKHDGRGLIQRFLISIPERFPKEKISLNNRLPEEFITNFNNNVLDLLKAKRGNYPCRITIDPNSRQEFEELYLDIIYESYEDVSYTTQQWLLKSFGNIIKLICLVKLAKVGVFKGQYKDILLDGEDLRNARKLFNYYYTHFKKVTEQKSNSLKESDLETFYRRLIEINSDLGLNGKISSTVINNYIKRFDLKQREQMLEVLEENNICKFVKSGKKKTTKIHPKIKKMPYEEAIKFVRTQN